MVADEIRYALNERNREDRKVVRLKLLMGVPFTLFGILVANVIALPILVLIREFVGSMDGRIYLLVQNAVIAAAIVIDLRRHPTESWYQPRYYQVGGGVKGHEFGIPRPQGNFIPPAEEVWLTHEIESRKGVFSGMPLMTSVSDPHNLAERARTIASGVGNLIMGGPRSLSRAMALRRRIRDRSRRELVASAERIASWLESNGVVPEAEVNRHLQAHPDEAAGLALARDLDVVSRRRIQAEFHYHVRGPEPRP